MDHACTADASLPRRVDAREEDGGSLRTDLTVPGDRKKVHVTCKHSGHAEGRPEVDGEGLCVVTSTG